VQGTDSDGENAPGKRKRIRRCHSGFKRFQKQMNAISEVLNAIGTVHAPTGHSLTMLLILGPKLSRPVEVMELCVPGMDQTSTSSHLDPAAAQVQHQRLLARLLRSVIPAVGSLPAPAAQKTMKMFVCVKALPGLLPSEVWEERQELTCCLKKCSSLSVRLNASGGSQAGVASELDHWRHDSLSGGGGDPKGQRTDPRAWHLLQHTVRGLRNQDV
jgi:hypothetical protein